MASSRLSNLHESTTDIEILFEEGLKKAGINYIVQYPLRTGSIADFAIIDRKILIYCDGEKWHDNPQAIRKDNFLDYLHKKAGWKVLRFKGNEIKNNLEKCINMIFAVFR